MKKKVFTIVSIVVVAVLYYFSISSLKGAENKQTTVSSTANDTFTNCIFNSPYSDITLWGKPQLNIDSNINRYNELNFNSIQWYDCGSHKYGTPDSVLTQEQISNFKGVLNTIRDGHLKGFYERSYINKYCYGQRLIYEVSPMNDGMEVNNGFVYLYNMNDAYGMDSGRTVLHATPGVQNSGYLCKNIYENLQHSDLFDFRQNDKGTWFIKPVMRIPDSIPPSKKVVRIDMINFNGIRVDSIIITADNFNEDNGSYSGNYLEKYFRLPNPLKISGDDTNTTSLNYGRTTDWTGWDTTCKVDFRVFWYGECEVWFDKMIVDDNIADYLFDPNLQNDLDIRIHDEVINFTDAEGNYSFFVDEICMSQYPCIQFVAKKMRDNISDSKLSIAVTRYLHIHGLKNDGLSYQVYLDSIKPNFLQADHHGFYTDEGTSSYNGIKIPNVFSSTQYDNKIPASWFSSTTEYNNKLQNNVFGSNTDLVLKNEIGTLIYEINKTRGSINGNYPNTKFIMQPQIHGWIFTDTATRSYYSNGLREPTNEEIQAQAMISIAHGADGLCWFVYNSHIWYDSLTKPVKYMMGLLNQEDDTSKRVNNIYGQNKWTYVSAMNGKILNWLPVLVKTNWAESFSVHNQNANHNYINDIRSKVPYINGFNTCADYGGQSEYFDCTEERYWEQGFFNPKDQSDKSKYFVMVNRRCVPPTLSAVGEVRTLRIKFNTLPDFNNWTLKDINTGQQITFDKNNIEQGGYLNLGEDTSDIGYFKPGEGKMFQLAPVMQEGGTLAGDETVSGSFYCNGKVLNNGHNITISHSTTISFADDSGIEMNGGAFTCGLNTYNITPVTLTGKTGSTYWNGLSLSNCSSIEIYNTNISKITSDTAKAVLISNCNNINISNTSFNMGSNAGAIQAVFTSNSEVAVTFNVISCNFDMGSSSYSAISIISNASSSLPVIIDWCTFSTTNENANAITLSGVTGGAIKNSTFNNFVSTINTLSSAIDLYSNKILGSSNSTGVLCVDGSSISLSPTSGLYLGGFNYIRNYGGSSSNICSDNSLFNIHNGKNHFDLDNIDNSKHLTGNFSGMQYLYVNASKNCFHKDSITNIEGTHSVIWNYNSDPVNFVFTDYSCELTPPENFQLFVYTGYSDTVYRSSGGEGGGRNQNKTVNITNIEENTYKSLKDTININLRKRNYLTVEDKSKQLLTQFPDSLESIGTVQKLYMASLNLDSSKIGITKTLLENIIVSNTQNSGLVKRAFYFIQKCKVKLKQYQSALDGFQYIMTQNPYTYEGLVVSWDYAATYLLMGTGGSNEGDFEQTTEELNTPADTLLNRMTKRDINTNKSSNTTANEQSTKKFYEKIKNVTKDDKSTQEAKVKTLEKKIETSKSKTEKNDAANELAKMKQIKEVVKLKKPNTIVTHTAIINSDIKKVFGIGKGSKDESKNNLIPQTYTLYQNYPNPFNPTTKIAYDIPRDAKVKLVIYDILGREMKTLVNNEFRSAGKYITEFNGSNFASGIYFARILVNEGKDFMAVKKMILVK